MGQQERIIATVNPLRQYAEQFVQREFERWQAWQKAEPADDPPQLRCSDCRWAQQGGCRRIDRSILLPAHSPFTSDVERSGLIICADFEPPKWNKWLCANWRGYNQWLELVRRDGVYADVQTRTQYARIVFRDSGVHPREVFCVPVQRWVYGMPVKDGVLRATAVIKYKPYRYGRAHPPVSEPIDGVPVDAPDSLGGDADI